MSRHSAAGAPDATAPASVARDLRPLSQAQAGLWFAQRLDPENPVFNTAQYVDIRGRLDVAAFTDAVDRAMQDAEALAVRIVDTEGGPRQIVDAARVARLEQIDLRGRGDEAARAAMARDLRTPIDPAKDRLARQVLFVLDGDRYVWYQRVHHLVIDGYGTALLTARICDLYSSAVAGTAPATSAFAPLDPVLDADAAYQGSVKRESDRAFWLDLLRDTPPAAGLAGVGVTAHEYLRAAVDLAPGAGDALRSLAAAAGMQWPDVVAALAAAYVGRHTGSSDVTVGLAAMERLGTPAARVPAMVMNILPWRVAIDEDQSLVDWLHGLAGQVRRLRRHGRYRGEHLRRDLGLLGADRRPYGVLVNVLPFDAPPQLAGVSADLHVLATGPVDDLTINIRGDALLERVRAELDGNPRLYSQSQLDTHARRFAAFVERVLGAGRLADVPTVTDAERDRLLVAFNDTAHPIESTTLDALVVRGCTAHAERTALRFGDRTLSYAELDADVTQIAHGLAASGVQQGDIVGIALDRSLDLVPAIYAVLRAGAAYLPLDLTQPAARLQRILDVARPHLVLTADDGAALPAGTERLTLGQVRARSRQIPLSPVLPDAAAYVIFTSGSTGEPKGVVVEHRAIVNRLLWMRDQYAIGPDDVLVQKTPITFDVSVWELFLAPLAGATLVVAPPGVHRDPRALAALLRERAVTVAHFVPSMLAEWLHEPHAETGALRAVICSGEALPAALRNRFHTRMHAELHNLYGPTEAAVDVTFWPAGRDDRSDPVPIGRPVWNTQIHVVDDRDRLAPPGVPGHLCLAGVQLARGYLGRPDLTAERFVANPFAPAPARMYRTGDLARWRDDGAVEFLGRSDHQVKIRGQRIELGEIESAILATGVVERAVVVLRDVRGAARLVAYVQPRGGAAPDEMTLRQAVAGRLPEVMMPSAFVCLDDWPVTANGKLDRARLPEPGEPASTGTALSSEAERVVARRFAEVLGVTPDSLSANADFFTLGGHSLLAAQAVRLLRRDFGDDIELSTIFLHPTVSGLAAQLETARAAAPAATDTAPLIRLQAGVSWLPALFCIHPAGGLSWCYLTLARLIDRDRPVYGLQAPGLAGGALPLSLEALADEYVQRLRSVQRDGPYHVLGWSIGGILAQAVAARLEALGQRVGVLAMLDAYPSDRWRSGSDATEAMALRALLLMAGEHPDDSTLTRSAVVARLRAGNHPLGMLSDDTLSGVLRVVQHNNTLVRRHRHTPCRAALLHFTADREHVNDEATADEWRPYVGGVEVHHVDALHAHMTTAGPARIIAGVLNGRLDS